MPQPSSDDQRLALYLDFPREEWAKPGSTDARIPVGLGACGVGVNRVLGVLEA
jgi:hypothetical protein